VVLFRVPGSWAGLAVANAVQMILFVQWLVRMVGELHSSMNSVSAVAYFSKSIPKEVSL
jgi:predicted anti-sigma-YlaC factor YlaD